MLTVLIIASLSINLARMYYLSQKKSAQALRVILFAMVIFIGYSVIYGNWTFSKIWLGNDEDMLLQTWIVLAAWVLFRQIGRYRAKHTVVVKDEKKS